MNRSAHFTLIELLVVIAIMAVLAAILLPVLGRAKEGAKLTDCTSRIRQMTVAMVMYFDDNDSYWPGQYYDVPGNVPRALDYRSACARYLGVYDDVINYKSWNEGRKLANPLMCPSSVSLNRPTVTFWVPADEGTYFDGMCLDAPAIVTGYTCNPFFGAKDTSPQRARRGDPPADPSKVLMLADVWREARPNYWYVSTGQGFFRFRHRESFRLANDGALNMSFIDGHVTAYKYTVGGPIYPTVGNGLLTLQPEFIWWAPAWGGASF